MILLRGRGGTRAEGAGKAPPGPWGACPGLGEYLASSPRLSSPPEAPAITQMAVNVTPGLQGGLPKPQDATCDCSPNPAKETKPECPPDAALSSEAEEALVPPVPGAYRLPSKEMAAKTVSVKSFSWHFSEEAFCPGESGRVRGRVPRQLTVEIEALIMTDKPLPGLWLPRVPRAF